MAAFVTVVAVVVIALIKQSRQNKRVLKLEQRLILQDETEDELIGNNATGTMTSRLQVEEKFYF